MRAENSLESAEMQRRKLTGIGRNVVKKITGREEAGWMKENIMSAWQPPI